jgi:hypothetical protein
VKQRGDLCIDVLPWLFLSLVGLNYFKELLVNFRFILEAFLEEESPHHQL